MQKLFIPAVTIAAVLFATAAWAQMAPTAPTKTGNSAKGPVLTDSRGMTLYIFDKDSNGKSACTGGCAANWPPLKASADAKAMDSYTVIARDDGSKQWAYKGHPLYGWKNDKKPGDITGDGFANGAWHIAKP